jgi:glucosamine--fructose-6-phosphate aminotransferase (isomerizing)
MGPLTFMAELEGTGSSRSLAIVLSQTGTSKSAIQAVEMARGHGLRTITLTGERKSPITRVSSEVLVFPVGPERVGPKTKGYTASILALLLFILSQVGGKLEAAQFSQELSHLIEACQDLCRDLAGTFREADFVMVTGQGRHYATALEGSLKITEMSGIPAAPFETEEAFHGRFHGLSSKSLAVFICASPAQREMGVTGAGVLSGLGVGARILNLGPGPSSPYDLKLPWPATDPLPELDLLSAIVPFQLLGWHLAKERGIIPESMKYPDLSKNLKIKME